MKKTTFIKGLLLSSLLLGVNSIAMAETKLYQGLGQTSNFRVGPGKDNKGVPVYSFNYVTAAGVFDEAGKIVNLRVDVLEVGTPNAKGKTMPRFSGWPGTSPYNYVDTSTGKVDGVADNSVEALTKEIENWESKRQRGNTYGMNPRNDWDKQMDFYENYFKGKTIKEVEEWFAKNTSDINGRVLKEKATKDEDKAKYAKLTESEKKELADVVAGATMSIQDSHGDILGAIKNAYNNRIEFTVK